MKDERLEQIRDSVEFQLEIAEHLKIDKEVILEEKELLDYIIFLQNECKSNGKIIKYLQNKIDKAIQFIKEQTEEINFDNDRLIEVLNILEGKDE